MASNAVANLTLVFRIVALLLLAASVVAVIGVFYTLIQIPSAVYHVCTEENWISYSQDFDLYADKVIGFLLATGVGAGFAVTCEFKGHLNAFFSLLEASQSLEGGDVSKSETEAFLNRSFIAIGFLFLGFLCMAVLSVVSSVAQAIEAKEESSFWDSFTSFFTFPRWTLFSDE